jgi:hypothetical protein
VLALKVGTDSPGGGNNFITFFGGDAAVGRIENIGGELSLKSGGADYAEWLPRMRADEVIENGDIVGVFGGKITKTTEGAHHVMAITRSPIVVGNMPREEDEHLYEKVAFIGQVPIKVRGVVQAGSFIVASGLNDGTGVAVSPQEMTPAHYAQVVGRAWESSDEESIKTINTVVGLHSSTLNALQVQQEEIKALRAELEKLKS